MHILYRIEKEEVAGILYPPVAFHLDREGGFSYISQRLSRW